MLVSFLLLEKSPGFMDLKFKISKEISKSYFYATDNQYLLIPFVTQDILHLVVCTPKQMDGFHGFDFLC